MKLLKSFSIALALLATAGIFAVSCNNNDDFHYRSGASTISEIIANDTSLSILNEAVAIAGLTDELSEYNSIITVLAPNNNAFRALFIQLGISSINELSSSQIRPVLLYHVLGSRVMRTSFRSGYRTTLDYYSYNNVNYPLSVYIDMSRSGIKINNVADIVQADILASNGCIHVINTVLAPPEILGIAINNPNFSTLVAAIVKSGLSNTLTGEGPFTLFAPSNSAFAAYFTNLGTSGVESLSPDALSNLLQYHTLQGFYPTSLLQNGSYTTLQGGSLQIGITSKSVTIDSTANVIIPNIYSNNGVVYAIDAVLVPPSPI